MPEQDNSTTSNLPDIFNVFGKKPTEVSDKRVIKPITTIKEYKSFKWIDIENANRGSLEVIAEEYQLDTIHLTQAISKDHISKIEIESNYIFLVMRFPHLSTTNNITPYQVSMFIGNHFFITVHNSLLQNPQTTYESNDVHSTQNNKSSARVALWLIHNLLLSSEDVTQKISLELDRIEEDVFDDESSDARSISQVRRKIVRIRRALSSQKNILTELGEVINKYSKEDLRHTVTLEVNFVTKLWELVEDAKETIEIYKDADFTNSQERTNQILAILTIIFTMAIPGTTIGTLYGMNILLPGGIETGSWMFLGKYTTLIVMVVISLGFAAGMYVYFKKRKWF